MFVIGLWGLVFLTSGLDSNSTSQCNLDLMLFGVIQLSDRTSLLLDFMLQTSMRILKVLRANLVGILKKKKKRFRCIVLGPKVDKENEVAV